MPAPILDNIPREMTTTRRWVLWKLDPILEGGKPKLNDGKPQFGKVPYNAKNDQKADSTDPSTWCSFNEAVARLNKGGFAGLGFVLGLDKETGRNFAGVDLDHLESAEDWQRARQVAARFDSYTDISPSEKGIHIIPFGKKEDGPPRSSKEGGPKCKNSKLNIEIYDHARFFTVTGNVLDGKKLSVNYREEVLREFYRETFPDKVATAAPVAASIPSSVVSVAVVSPNLSDEEIITLAGKAANGAKFMSLYYEGDTSAYDNDDSSADMALMCLLAFYTKDSTQLERIFGSSALAAREKWQKRADYRKMTIEAALNLVKEQYNPRHAFYELSPNGNADRLVDRFGEGLLYRIRMSKSGTASGDWLIWNGNVWRPDDTLRIEHLGREIIDGIFEEAQRISDESVRKSVRGFALKNDNIRSVRLMLDAAKSDERVGRRAKDFDINSQLIGLPGEGGVILELKDHSYEIREARKSDMVTLAAGVLPARREDLRQPKKWLAFLDMIFKGDKDLIKYIQKLMGYSLLGTQAEQLFALFHGTGANGKSTLIKVWYLILGSYGTYAAIQTFSKKFSDKEIRSDLRAILKNRLVAVVEGKARVKLDETLINQWTSSQEPITTRDLYEPTVSEWPQGLLVIVANNCPVISETNFGIWRRVRLVPFNVNLEQLLKPSEIVREYEKVLFAEEGSLIFRWMLQGYEMYRAEGLRSPAAVEEATRKYEAESNTLLQFCQEMLMLDPDAKIQASELINAYSIYCTSEHIEAVDLRKVKEEITEKIYAHAGVGHSRRRNAVYYIGLRLKTDLDFEMEESIKDFVKEALKYQYHPMEWSPLINKDGKPYTLNLFGVGLV